ncbi:MAG: chemotaxis response regulator protein-glutamate methylesterase [Oscillospiraceae bacterium]|jgi:two-component system chemotaxis response regulator CheB|nr:chemotaxis response regulator protein-glutamate methylesterase [Oscillospiraceae bacterium]
MPGKYRILVVDDSMFFRTALIKGLSGETDIEIVGEAHDPYDARDKILDLEPDLMLLDLEMPYMNGIEFLKVLLPQWPIPVVVLSNAKHLANDALRAGALDFMSKPDSRSNDVFNVFITEVARRIRKFADVGHKYRSSESIRNTAVSSSGTGYKFNGIIALGASTGGTQSTAKILKALPGDMPGMVIVQHMPPDFTRMYAENLDKDCTLKVKEAVDGDTVEKGVVLIAPGDLHMEVVKRGTGYAVNCHSGQKVSGHCPSVDVLFHSVAKAAGQNALGIILTGMGADGAKGLLSMRQRGAYTIGQDEKSCIVYGMPKEAYDIGAVARQAPLDNIASMIMTYCKDLRG